MKLALSSAYQAKNSTIKRNARTPEAAVFGKSLRWMSSLLNDDDDSCLAARTAEGEALRASMMRAPACRKLHKRDLMAKYRRALKRPPKATTEKVWLSGTRVYFWKPKILKGRRRRDPGAWRGPATVTTTSRGVAVCCWSRGGRFGWPVPRRRLRRKSLQRTPT